MPDLPGHITTVIPQPQNIVPGRDTTHAVQAIVCSEHKHLKSALDDIKKALKEISEKIEGNLKAIDTKINEKAASKDIEKITERVRVLEERIIKSEGKIGTVYWIAMIVGGTTLTALVAAVLSLVIKS